MEPLEIPESSEESKETTSNGSESDGRIRSDLPLRGGERSQEPETVPATR